MDVEEEYNPDLKEMYCRRRVEVPIGYALHARDCFETFREIFGMQDVYWEDLDETQKTKWRRVATSVLACVQVVK